MNWNQLRSFRAVAETGSITRAAKKSNLCQSAVSRQIIALEDRLKVSLFHRERGRITLTEAGSELCQGVDEIADTWSRTMSRIDEYRGLPTGPLRVSTTMALGSAWLTSRMDKFRAEFPDTNVSLLLTDQEDPNLSSEQVDVAIRFARPTKNGLVHRPLMSVRYQLFASTDYLKAHGTPTCPEDLDRHAIIAYGGDGQAPMAGMDWHLTIGRTPTTPREPVLSVNSEFGMYQAAKNGGGIAALPIFLCAGVKDLIAVLPEYECPEFETYLVYPQSLGHLKRVEVFQEFLLAEVTADQNRLDISEFGPHELEEIEPNLASMAPSPKRRTSVGPKISRKNCSCRETFPAQA